MCTGILIFLFFLSLSVCIWAAACSSLCHSHLQKQEQKQHKHQAMCFFSLNDAIVKLISLCFIDPPFISKARSTGTPIGQKGILQCEASAVPRAEFEWYKEDRRQVSPLSIMISSG